VTVRLIDWSTAIACTWFSSGQQWL